MKKLTVSFYLGMFMGVAAVSMAVGPRDGSIAALLHRRVWAFSKEEIAGLNSTPIKEIEPFLLDAAKADEPWIESDEKVVWFRFVDLDHDGNYEAIARIREAYGHNSLDIISSGKGCSDIGIPYGRDDMYETEKETLLIAEEPLFTLPAPYPQGSFPRLFALRGCKLIDMSAEHPQWYEKFYVPQLDRQIVDATARANELIRRMGKGKRTMERYGSEEEVTAVELSGLMLSQRKAESLLKKAVLSGRDRAGMVRLITLLAPIDSVKDSRVRTSIEEAIAKKDHVENGK